MKDVREQREILEKPTTEQLKRNGNKSCSSNSNECLIVEEMVVVVHRIWMIIIVGMTMMMKMGLEGSNNNKIVIMRKISMISGIEIIRNRMKKGLMNKNR